VFTVVSLVPIWLAFITATFPGELIDEWIGPWEIIPQNRVTAWLGGPKQPQKEHVRKNR
jgi:hypothetical protein